MSKHGWSNLRRAQPEDGEAMLAVLEANEMPADVSLEELGVGNCFVAADEETIVGFLRLEFGGELPYVRPIAVLPARSCPRSGGWESAADCCGSYWRHTPRSGWCRAARRPNSTAIWLGTNEVGGGPSGLLRGMRAVSGKSRVHAVAYED